MREGGEERGVEKGKSGESLVEDRFDTDEQSFAVLSFLCLSVSVSVSGGHQPLFMMSPFAEPSSQSWLPRKNRWSRALAPSNMVLGALVPTP